MILNLDTISREPKKVQEFLSQDLPERLIYFIYCEKTKSENLSLTPEPCSYNFKSTLNAWVCLLSPEFFQIYKWKTSNSKTKSFIYGISDRKYFITFLQVLMSQDRCHTKLLAKRITNQTAILSLTQDLSFLQHTFPYLMEGWEIRIVGGGYCISFKFYRLGVRCGSSVIFIH